MRSLICLLLLALSADTLYAEPEPLPGEPPCTENDERPRCLFDFDEDGKVKTKDGKAERTFSFPPVKVGFTFDLNSDTVLKVFYPIPYVSIQILDWEMFGELFNFDFGVSTGRVFLDVSWEMIPIMKIGPVLWAGYNVGEEDWAAGFGFNILKF